MNREIYRPPKDQHMAQLVNSYTETSQMNEKLHEAERQLHASENRFAALALATGQIVWTIPPDGVVDDMPLWRVFTGQTSAEVSGWGWLDAIHPDDQARTRELWEKAVATRDRFETEYRVRRADGDYRVLLARAVPVLTAEGHIQEWVGSSTDITAQKQLELRAREALDAVLAMAEVVVAPPEAPVSDDDNDTTPDADAAWHTTRGVAKRLAELTCQLLGCQRVGIAALDETLHESPLVAIGLTSADEQRWLRHEAASLSSHLHAADLARLRQGEVIVAAIVPAAWEDPANFGRNVMLIAPVRIGAQLTGFIALDHGGTAHDYTTAEIALAQTVTRLVALVIERDRLVHEREAAHSKVLALQELNRRMDEFLGVVSHELRTPLTAMKASIQLSERRIQSLLKADAALPEDYVKKLGQTYDILDRSDRQANRLTRLIGELLDTSRIQLGKIEFHIAPCDINALVREVIEEQRQAWPERNIILPARDGDETALTLAADAERIEQVVTNLLANALKYAPAETPIEVTLSMEGERARVSVRDHGPGIPTAEQSKIWERFYRVPGTQELNGGGIGFGLGLFICQTIIAQHGGEIGVISAAGEGATFWFTLPAVA